MGKTLRRSKVMSHDLKLSINKKTHIHSMGGSGFIKTKGQSEDHEDRKSGVSQLSPTRSNGGSWNLAINRFFFAAPFISHWRSPASKPYIDRRQDSHWSLNRLIASKVHKVIFLLFKTFACLQDTSCHHHLPRGFIGSYAYKGAFLTLWLPRLPWFPWVLLESRQSKG